MTRKSWLLPEAACEDLKKISVGSTYGNHKGCHEFIPALIKTELVFCKGKLSEITFTLTLLNKTYMYFNITHINQNVFFVTMAQVICQPSISNKYLFQPFFIPEPIVITSAHSFRLLWPLPKADYRNICPRAEFVFLTWCSTNRMK